MQIKIFNQTKINRGLCNRSMRLLLCTLALVLLDNIQNNSVQALSTCNGSEQIIQDITIDTASTEQSCDDSTITRYYIEWENMYLQFQYKTNRGVLEIDTGFRGAKLRKESSAGNTQWYYLNQIISRSPGINALSGVAGSGELQFYFSSSSSLSSSSDGIILSVILQLNSEYTQSQLSQFMVKMDPTIVGEKQTINLHRTIKNDLSIRSSISEYSNAVYKGNSVTWLFFPEYLQIGAKQYEALTNLWDNTYLLYKYDNLDTEQVHCAATTVKFAFCTSSNILRISNLIAILLVFKMAF